MELQSSWTNAQRRAVSRRKTATNTSARSRGEVHLLEALSSVWAILAIRLTAPGRRFRSLVRVRFVGDLMVSSWRRAGVGEYSVGR